MTKKKEVNEKMEPEYLHGNYSCPNCHTMGMFL